MTPHSAQTTILQRLSTIPVSENLMPKEEILSGEQRTDQIRESVADWSALPTYEESSFLHQHDYWTVQYHGRSALLKSSRGLYYLAALLRNPGCDFHVREFLACPMDGSTSAAAVPMHRRVRGGLYPGIPVLDAKAKAEYKCRLEELRQELDEAQRFNDPPRRTHAQNELQALADHLASAVGFGGRDRRTSSDAERARSAVTKCIRKAIRQISEAIPSLGYHLATRIKTGYFCSYKPHPDRPVVWKL